MSYKEAVFSDYEVKQIGFKVGDAEKATVVDCVGSMTINMDVKTITKNCRGVPMKTRTRGTGAGSADLSVHIPWGLYVSLYNMDLDGYVAGVAAYGKDSLHPEIVITALVEDEDGIEKLVALPKTTLTSGPNPSVTNGSDTVEEVSFSVSVSPDDNGNGLYEAVKSDLPSTGTVASKWMEEFTPSMVLAAGTTGSTGA